MIPLLLYLLFKKTRDQKRKELIIETGILIIKKIIKPFIYILALLLLGSVIISAHGQKLNYKIICNGNEIGWMKLERTYADNVCSMTLNSTINFRIIFSFTATVLETAKFSNGKLIFSSQYHKTNDNVKLNKQTRFTGDHYEVSEDDENEQLSFPGIYFNLLCLYFIEPVTVKRVYCDKHECFANITKTKDGGYKVVFPNGDSNCYYYTHGTCSRIEIEHSFYSAEVILNP
ncbi:MAG: DUF6134 family protein [Ferruginibacter sp.]